MSNIVYPEIIAEWKEDIEKSLKCIEAVTVFLEEHQELAVFLQGKIFGAGSFLTKIGDKHFSTIRVIATHNLHEIISQITLLGYKGEKRFVPKFGTTIVEFIIVDTDNLRLDIDISGKACELE